MTSLWGLVFGLITPIVDYVATYYRPLAMTVVVLPLSFLTRNYLSLREWVFHQFFADSTGSGHEERVARVQSAVKARLSKPKNERKKMCTARAPWQNLSTRFADYKSNSDCIFVGDFRSVIEVDENNMTVKLEPQVDVGQITRYLLPRGYILVRCIVSLNSNWSRLTKFVVVTFLNRRQRWRSKRRRSVGWPWPWE
jgi:delta24-sterol reductase